MGAKADNRRFFTGLQVVFALVEVGAEEDEGGGGADDETGW